MKRFIAICLAVNLTGCSAFDTALSAVGVKSAVIAKINTETLALGTLGCQSANLLAAVPSVLVINATAAAVAAACAAISVNGVPELGAVPVPLPVASDVPVATVPVPVAAAVAASVPATKL